MHLTSVVSHREYCSIAYCPWSMTSLETDMEKLQTGLLTRFSILVALNVVIPLIVSLVCSFCSEDRSKLCKSKNRDKLICINQLINLCFGP